MAKTVDTLESFVSDFWVINCFNFNFVSVQNS